MKHGNQTILLAASALLGIATLTGCGSSAPKVGILTFGSFEALTNATDGFVAALSDAGFKDGDKISLVKQNPEADMATNTSMMNAGKIIFEASGKEKEKLTVEDLLKKFQQASEDDLPDSMVLG